jgi:integrase
MDREIIDLLVSLNNKFDILLSAVSVGGLSVVGNAVEEESGLTVGEWFFIWLNDYKKPTLRENTFKVYGNLIRNYILSNDISKMKLSAVKTIHAEHFLNSILFGRTRKFVYVLFKSGFDKARKLEYVSINPCDNVELNDYAEVERRALTRREQLKFVKAVEGLKYRERVRYMLYLTTGIRTNEILRISLDSSKKMLYVDGTKTKSSKRYVPLTDSMLNDLKEFWANGEDFKINYGNTSRNFKRLCDQVKIKGVCLYSRRHTVATRC